MVMVVLLLLMDLIIIGVVLSGARDQDLSVNRLQSVQAFYAAEAGANMAIRELMENVDEDGDGAIGTISDDGDAASDPALGPARVAVTAVTVGSQTTISCNGRAGDSRREIEVTLQ